MTVVLRFSAKSDEVQKRADQAPIAENSRRINALCSPRAGTDALARSGCRGGAASWNDPPGTLHVARRKAGCAERSATVDTRPQASCTLSRVLVDRKSTRLNSSHVAISYAV